MVMFVVIKIICRKEMSKLNFNCRSFLYSYEYKLTSVKCVINASYIRMSKKQLQNGINRLKIINIDTEHCEGMAPVSIIHTAFSGSAIAEFISLRLSITKDSGDQALSGRLQLVTRYNLYDKHTRARESPISWCSPPHLRNGCLFPWHWCG